MKTTIAIFIFASLTAGVTYAAANGRGTVSGTALDSQGKPLEGVRVWVKPSLTTGLVEVRTGEGGRYHAAGLINVPYNTFAWYKTTYRDRSVCMRLAPASLNEYDSFVPTDGAIRNFKLRISGSIDDRDGIYYGAQLRVFYQDISRDQNVQVILEPLGPLVDGTIGKPLVRVPKDMMIEDIPVGAYRATAQITDPNGQKRAARVSLKNFDSNPAQEVTVEWESKDSCIGSFGNGLDRAYLYIYNR